MTDEDELEDDMTDAEKIEHLLEINRRFHRRAQKDEGAAIRLEALRASMGREVDHHVRRARIAEAQHDELVVRLRDISARFQLKDPHGHVQWHAPKILSALEKLEPRKPWWRRVLGLLFPSWRA